MAETRISCIIIDDEPLAVRLLEKYAITHSDVELKGCFTDAEEALEACLKMEPDTVFLDINMPRISGLDFARNIDPEKTRIVFVTAYDNYAVDGFRLNAADYLLKPVSYEEFGRSVDRVRQWKESQNALRRLWNAENAEDEDNLNSEQGDRKTAENEFSGTAHARFLTVRSEYRLIRIPLDDILFLEGLKDYVRIRTVGDEKPVLTIASLKSLESRLPTDRFLRVHRSYIVGMNHVKIFSKNCIDFGRYRIPVSDSCRPAFMARMGVEN